jgi:Innexin.
MITDGMRGAIVTSKEDRRERQKRLVQYIIDTLHMHNVYAAGYFFCEFLNFVNVVSNLCYRVQ